MLNRSRTKLIQGAAAVGIALCVACGGGEGAGGDGANDERRAQAPDRGTVPPPAQALIALSGCVEAAPGTNQYVLRNVRIEPQKGSDPQRTTTTSGGHGITEGAWVRLDAGGDGQSAAPDLKSHLGQRVNLKGTVADDGRNTIGTAGTPGVQVPTGDRSQAAAQGHHSEKQKGEMGRIARESMADGTAALVRVQEVSGTGDRGAAAPQR